MQNYNQTILENIEKKLAPEIRPVHYLMNTLNLGKEPAYRRIRNKVPFTFEEVAIIAKNMGLSVDSILQQNTQKNIASFSLNINPEWSKERVFEEMLINGITELKMLYNAKQLKIEIVLNRLPWHFFSFPTIFKFQYCRFLHLYDGIPIRVKFSDITVPERIAELHKQTAFYCKHLSNLTCIVEENILNSFLEELNYFYQRKFLSADDLKAIQAELLDFLNSMAEVNQKGVNSAGSKYEILMSQYPIDTNCAHYEFDGETMDQYWIYFENPICIKNNFAISNLQRSWIKSCAKYAILLTKSNDKMNAEIYQKIYGDIMSLRTE